MSHPAPHAGRIAILLLIVSAVSGAWGEAQDLIFADSFETGDMSAWNLPAAEDPKLSFADKTLAFDESAGVVGILLDLSEAAVSPVTVQWSTWGRTAEGGVDFSPESGELTIAEGQLGGSIEITLVDDGFVEWPSESFDVTLTGVVGAEIEGAWSTTVEILDDDEPILTILPSEMVVSEGDGWAVPHAYLSTYSNVVVGFLASSIDGTATGGDDYLGPNGSMGFPGSTSVPIPVILVDDVLFEGPESFAIEISNPSFGILGEQIRTTITIEDNDPPPEISFAETSVKIDESVGTIQIAVSLSAVSGLDASVDYEVATGVATTEEDFVLADGTLVIEEGFPSGTISIEIVDDDLPEYEEDFSIVLSNPVGASLGSKTSISVTIESSDLPPVTDVFFSVGDTTNTAEEGIEISISGGVATFVWPEDPLFPLVGQMLVYGASGQSIFVEACADEWTCSVVGPGWSMPADVSSETVTEVRHSFGTVSEALAGIPGVGFLGTTDLAGARIALHVVCYGMEFPDTEPVLVDGWTTHQQTPLTIQSASYRNQFVGWEPYDHRFEIEGPDCIQSTIGDIRLKGLQLHCSTDPSSDLIGIVFDGPGVSGAAEIAGTLIRLDSQEGMGDRVGISTDSVSDLDLRILNTVVFDIGTGTDRHAGILIDDEPVIATVANSSLLGGEHAVRQVSGSVTTINTLASGCAAACFDGEFTAQSHHNASSDGSSPGEAAAVADSIWLQGPITGPGTDFHLDCDPIHSATVVHSTVDLGETWMLFDSDLRTGIRTAPTETLVVEVEFEQPIQIAGAQIGFGYSQLHKWSFAVADSFAEVRDPESSSYRQLVTKAEVSATGLPDPFYTWDRHFFGLPETARAVRLEVEKQEGFDHIYLGDFKLLFARSPCDGGADLSIELPFDLTTDVDGHPREVPWDIGADEGSYLVPELLRSTQNVWETEGVVGVEVSLGRPAPAALKVGFRARQASATAGVDFEAVEGQMTIPAGADTATIDIPIFPDGDADDGEEFVVEILDPVAGYSKLDDARIFIRDGAPPPRVLFVEDAIQVSEADGNVTVTIRLAEEAESDVIVHWKAEDSSALMGIDFGGAQGNVTIPEETLTAEIEVPIIDDLDFKTERTFFVTVHAVTNGEIRAPSRLAVTILDDDGPAFAFAEEEYEFDENVGDAIIDVTLSLPVEHAASVEVVATGDGAVLGEDFATPVCIVEFDIGETESSCSIELIDDTIDEYSETVMLELANPVGAELDEPTEAELEIEDDDPAPTISFASASKSVTEGAGSVEVDLVLSSASGKVVFASWTPSDGTAVEFSDYVPEPGFRDVEIEPGSVSAEISIQIIGDTAVEDDETFFVVVESVWNAEVEDPSIVEITITNDDLVPEVRFAGAEFSADEGSSSIEITLEIIPPWPVPASIGVELAEGSATATDDFDATPLVVDLPAEWPLVTFSVPLVDDIEVENHETFFVQLTEPTGCVISSPGSAEVTILDNDLVAVIGEPDGRVYADGDELTMDGSASTIPAGYETWFAVLRDDGSVPMPLVHLADGLVDTFTASWDDPAYRVRLVVAAPGTMPDDQTLRGADLPCSHPEPDFGCTSTDVAIEKADPHQLYRFTTSYVFPEAILLVWGGSSTPSMELERSADGGETWIAFDEPGNQDHDSSHDTHNEYPDRTVQPGQTYHYRIKWNTFSEWTYLGGTLKAPGDPVSTPVWAAPRPVPVFESVDWDCPEGASPFLCLGTLTLHLEPEPGESLAGSTIRIFLNEETFEALDGNGDEVPIIWPETFPFAGRDEPGCVTRKAQPDLIIDVVEEQESVTVELDGVHYGANSFRFEVDDGQGGFSERALLYGIHDELGEYLASHEMFVPLLFGTDVTVEEFVIEGLGPVGIRSPDCYDGDWRKIIYPTHAKQIYAAELWYQHATQGTRKREVGTDDFGRWSRLIYLSDGFDHRVSMHRIYSCHTNVTGHIGRSILAGDGTPITTTETAQDVCADYGPTGHDPLHVNLSLEGPHPPVLDSVPAKLFSLSDQDVVNLGMRFRITDLHHDVDLSSVTVTNESLDPPVTSYGYYSEDQFGDEAGDWGWFVAQVPMTVPDGQQVADNELRIQASDVAGNTLDELVTVAREGPLVWAEIAEPVPVEAEPRQVVTFDGTASIVPYIDELGGGVARWVFFLQIAGEWRPYRDAGYGNGSSGLIQNVEMPRESALKARLIVAASILDVPYDPWDADLECEWNVGDGRCDSNEVIVPLVSPGCIQSGSWFSVEIDDEAILSGEKGVDLRFKAEANTTLSPIAYRWAFYDRSDVNLEFPIGDTSHPIFSWSLSNNDVTATAGELGLGEGDYLLIAEARYPDDGCDENVWEWRYGRSAVQSVRVYHALDGIAPGEVVEGTGFRVYSSTWEVGSQGFVFIDDVVGDENPPLVFSGEIEPGGFVRVLADPSDVYAKETPWIVSVSPSDEGIGRSLWLAGLKVHPAGNESAPLVIQNEEDISCGGAGTECAHEILPGQTIQGNWHEPGDNDQFGFIAGAGTRVRVRLDRSDTGNSPQHPGSPIPEVFIIRPDGLATAYYAPLGLDDTGASFEHTLTLDGRHHIAVRSSKGSGDYLLSLEKLEEGGNGNPTFGWTDDLIHIATATQGTATMRVPVLDGYGNPVSGIPIVWRQGSECGLNDFCPSGVSIDIRAGYNGLAFLQYDPQPGESILWQPQFVVEGATKLTPRRIGVEKRIVESRRAEAVFGRVKVYSGAVSSIDLPPGHRAQAISKRMQTHASLTAPKTVAKNDVWCSQSTTCIQDSKPVFRAIHLELDENETLLDIELRILDGGTPAESLDGHEVMTDVSLTVEADAVIKNAQGGISRVPIDKPVGVMVIGDRGGAIEVGGAVCEYLEFAPGPFTFKTGSDAGIHYVYDEPDGSPCCWIPTEHVVAGVIANVEADDGQGGSIPLSTSSTTFVESIPRPSDPCEVRFYPTDQPVVNTNRYHASHESGDFVSLGYAYLTDVCDNVVHGVSLEGFQIVNPQEPAPGADGVWATAATTPDEWRFLLTLRGRTAGSATQIPNGTYTIDFQVASQSQCSDEGVITDSMIVQAIEAVPRLTFHWDWDFDGEASLRGPNPKYSTIAPGSTVRDASDRIAVWRVPAYDDPDPNPYFEGPFTSVPVKIYVAEVGTVPFDWDGNVRDTYLEPVEGVVLCTGVVEEMTDEDGDIQVYQGPVRSSCDRTWTTVAEGFAFSDPLLTGQPANTWIPMGLGVGIVKAPVQPGKYVLVVEPEDDAFLRGDSWRIDSTWLDDNFMKLDVGGGVYLDEEYERFGATIDVPEPRQVYVQAKIKSLEATVTLDIEYTDPNDQGTQTASVAMNRMGLSDENENESIYLSEPFELTLDEQKSIQKSVPMFTVKIGGKIISWFQGKMVATATIENDGPVDLDIDGDNDNGAELPDRSAKEEDLETEGGYGKIIFSNINNDDFSTGDRIPDYADLDVPGEQNFVPVTLTIDLPGIVWSAATVKFEYDGLTVVFDPAPIEITLPGDPPRPTGYFDYSGAKQVQNGQGEISYPPIRLWNISDASQARHFADLLLPDVLYNASDLGFGQGDNPGSIVCMIEGINQIGGSGTAPQPSRLKVVVTAGQMEYSDSVSFTVVDANLGVNNSNSSLLEDEAPLRPGVPDPDFNIDQFDEIVEDQGEGFVFWKQNIFENDAVDFFPIQVAIPSLLDGGPFEFFLRADPPGVEEIEVVRNPSPKSDWIGYLKERGLARKFRLARGPDSIWSTGKAFNLDLEYGIDSYVLRPKYVSNLNSIENLTIHLVAKDNSGHEISIDSVLVTLKPLFWAGEDRNEFFWMGSSRGEPSGSFPYPGDSVAGQQITQTVPTYPPFSWESGPTPDSEKKNFVVFVHGFNINRDQAFVDAAEVFKRFWWAGYRGNFVGLTWHGDEDDPLNHSCDGLPRWLKFPCVAFFYPNMENALLTSPALREFIESEMIGAWNADPANIYLVAHSLGNLVSLDALRLYAIDNPGGESPLIKHMISVEAAVWEETLWPEEGIEYPGFSETVDVDRLMRGSWAFWFNQNDHPISASTDKIVNSWVRFDEALEAMVTNDRLPLLGRYCAYGGDGQSETEVRPCPRVDRLFQRGKDTDYRVPMYDGLEVGENGKRPDLGFAIPALLRKNAVNWVTPRATDVTTPLGSTITINPSVYNLDAAELGWGQTKHSDFLEAEFQKIWPWYERLFEKSAGPGSLFLNGMIPRGQE